jgi:hypothetical protein
MPEREQKNDYLELFDVSDNSVIGTVPIDKVKLVPRIGERIFLPLHHPGDWAEFKIVDIEYFLSTSESQFGEPGTIRVTLYAEKVRRT